MNAQMLEMTRSIPTENLREIAIALNDATTTEDRMVCSATMAVLEERLGAEAFLAFCDELDA